MKRELTLNRRRFCHFVATVLAACCLPGCSNFQPIPFATGKTVTAPIGCRDLRKRNPKGDC